MYYQKRKGPGAYIPTNTAGNLYYVRLKTNAGIFYKIGFTTMSSAHARLAFNGAGHEELHDRTLLFSYFDDAFFIEQRCHKAFGNRRAFSKYSAIPYLPLAGNGQSELYADDVLRLDPEFTQMQSDRTKQDVSRLHALHNPRAKKSESSPIVQWTMFVIFIAMTFSIMLGIYVAMFAVSLVKPELKPKIGLLQILGECWVSAKRSFLGSENTTVRNVEDSLNPEIEELLKMLHDRAQMKV